MMTFEQWQKIEENRIRVEAQTLADYGLPAIWERRSTTSWSEVPFVTERNLRVCDLAEQIIQGRESR